MRIVRSTFAISGSSASSERFSMVEADSCRTAAAPAGLYRRLAAVLCAGVLLATALAPAERGLLVRGVAPLAQPQSVAPYSPGSRLGRRLH